MTTRARAAGLVYGPYHRYVATLDCAWSDDDCRGPTQSHHVRSVGAGGRDFGNCVPLCAGHHHELHAIGRRTFEAKYPLDLAAIAEQIGREYSLDPTPDDVLF